MRFFSTAYILQVSRGQREQNRRKPICSSHNSIRSRHSPDSHFARDNVSSIECVWDQMRLTMRVAKNFTRVVSTARLRQDYFYNRVKTNLLVTINRIIWLNLTNKISERTKIGPIDKNLWQCNRLIFLFFNRADFAPALRQQKKEIGRQLVTCRLARAIKPTNGVDKLCKGAVKCKV